MENPIKIDVLEQAAIELNQLKFHMSRCKSDISADQEKVCIFRKNDSMLIAKLIKMIILGNYRIGEFISNMSERVIPSMYTRKEFKLGDPLP